MNDPILDEIPVLSTVKIYQERAISTATFLGGPLAAGYLIAENFKAFGESDKARATWIWVISASILIFSLAFLIPDGIHIPNYIFPLIYAAIVSSLVKHYQGKSIAAHLASGGALFSWWRTLLVAVISLIMLVFALVCATFFI